MAYGGIKRRSTLRKLAESITPFQQVLLSAGLGLATGAVLLSIEPGAGGDLERRANAAGGAVGTALIGWATLRVNDGRKR